MWYWSGTVGLKQKTLCSSLGILNYVNADSRWDFQSQFFQVCLMVLLTETDLGGSIHLGSFSSTLSRGPAWSPSHLQNDAERSQSTAQGPASSHPGRQHRQTHRDMGMCLLSCMTRYGCYWTHPSTLTPHRNTCTHRRNTQEMCHPPPTNRLSRQLPFSPPTPRSNPHPSCQTIY